MQINGLHSAKSIENGSLSSVKALTGRVRCLLDPEVSLDYLLRLSDVCLTSVFNYM
jgi:hypothetical protein